MKKKYDDEIRKLERDRSDLKYKLGDKDGYIRELEHEMHKMRQDFKEKEDELETEN